jgi:hypothetical protein
MPLCHVRSGTSSWPGDLCVPVRWSWQDKLLFLFLFLVEYILSESITGESMPGWDHKA